MNPEDLIAAMRRAYPCEPPRPLGLGRRPAVMVVDFIEGFTNPKSPLSGSWDREIKHTSELLACAREAGVPAIFSIVEFNPSDLATSLLYAKTPRIGILLKGSEWTAVDRRLAPATGDLIVSKKHGSAFFGTSLASQLQLMNVDTLLICGCVTSGCVRATAVDASQCGFRPAVVGEAVGDRSPLAHEANLIDIDQRYGDVIGLQSALDYLRS
jgi:nicotinamidase-related amidase